jgi:putative redox protein
MRIKIQRKDDNFLFEAIAEDGNKVLMDASPSLGAAGLGFRPMQMLIAGLGGCSGIDIVSILKKMKQDITDFRMEIDGEREVGVEPSLWREVNVHFFLEGKIDPEKAKRAVELSMEKYCSVSKTLEKAGTQINWKLSLNNHEQ